MGQQSKWTSEPWAVRHGDMVVPADDVDAGMPYLIASCDDVRAEVDAARIVACVNALAGVSDPAAFVEAARKAVTIASETRWEVTGEARDRLNAAIGAFASADK